MGGPKRPSGNAAQGAAKAEAAKTERRTSIHSQLHKTKFCMYHLKGACQYGAECAFAHSCAELQAMPDLRKTRLCVAFTEGPGCQDSDCPFAHGEEELRSTDMFYKKTLCIWNEKGRCRNGDQCRFAHGAGELRNNKAQPTVVSSTGVSNSRRRGQAAIADGASSDTTLAAEPMKVLPRRLVEGEAAAVRPSTPPGLEPPMRAHLLGSEGVYTDEFEALQAQLTHAKQFYMPEMLPFMMDWSVGLDQGSTLDLDVATAMLASKQFCGDYSGFGDEWEWHAGSFMAPPVLGA